MLFDLQPARDDTCHLWLKFGQYFLMDLRDSGIFYSCPITRIHVHLDLLLVSISLGL